jgi:hypothetical protein
MGKIKTATMIESDIAYTTRRNGKQFIGNQVPALIMQKLATYGLTPTKTDAPIPILKS